MKTTQQFLGLAIAATLIAGVAVIFVKDTSPDSPVALPTPSQTLTLATESPTPDAETTTTFEPAATGEPEPAVRPRPPQREPLPDTGLPSQAILAMFALFGAFVLALERRRAR